MDNKDALAQWLCLTFSDELDIPSHYKPDSKKKKTKKKEDSKIQKRFNANLQGWAHVINVVESNAPEPIAKRLVNLRPFVEFFTEKAIECQDFIDLYDILIKRRDIHNCSDDELGKLSILLSALQKEIEQVVESRNAQQSLRNSTTLKDDRAQELMNMGTYSIDGIEVKFWRGHSFDSVSTQETWNKVRAQSEQNSRSSGESGTIVFSGILQIPRQEAWDFATEIGFNVRSNVSRQTDYMVLGSENVSPSKVAKAIQLNSEGADIKFMDEMAFLTLVSENLETFESTEDDSMFNNLSQ